MIQLWRNTRKLIKWCLTSFRHSFQSTKLMLLNALVAIVLVNVIWFLVVQFGTSRYQFLDLWLSRDQQAQLHFNQGEFQAAAVLFENQAWQGTSLYAAQNFALAAQSWGRQEGAIALFNRGNALAQLEQYLDAADSYFLALELKPDWLEAQKNRELVLALAIKAKPLDDSDQGKPAQLDPDDIVFDERAKNNDVNSNTDRQTPLTEDEMQALIEQRWMRRLDSTPVDFLRLKFRYQATYPAAQAPQ